MEFCVDKGDKGIKLIFEEGGIVLIVNLLISVFRCLR